MSRHDNYQENVTFLLQDRCVLDVDRIAEHLETIFQEVVQSI